VLADSEPGYWLLPLEPAGTSEPRHVLGGATPPLTDEAPHLADAAGGVWLVRDEHAKPYGTVFAGDFAAKPMNVGNFDRYLVSVAFDASEVFVGTNDLRYCPSCTNHSVITAFSRTGKSTRVVVKTEKLVSIDVDETDVYWSEGELDPTVYRQSKRGGTPLRIGETPSQGAIFALRDHIVHHEFSGTSTRVAPKSTGAFEIVTALDLNEAVITHDADGLCWISRPHTCDDAGTCTIDTERFEPRIRCWHPGLTEPDVVQLPQEPTWMAMLGARVTFGTATGVWSMQRP
jgi:hypothetical protein